MNVPANCDWRNSDEGFHTWTPAAVTTPESQPGWLIESLWQQQAVGIIGGQPKCCKSFLALHLAVAVASAKPCLQRFAVHNPGPVLLFAAEDARHVIAHRLNSIAQSCATDFQRLDIDILNTQQLRLDFDHHRQLLFQTVQRIQPRLLILDPLTRVHRVNENITAEISPILHSLRILQRRFHTAVALVHHAGKSTDAQRPGQTLRGSSDLHAWGDSNLYLRKKQDHFILSVEHRAAPCPPDLQLELHASAARGPALRLRQPPLQTAPAAPQRHPKTIQQHSTTDKPFR